MYSCDDSWIWVSHDLSEIILICCIYLKYTFLGNVKVFTVTFDQFNASLLNTNIHLFQKNLADPKVLNSACMIFLSSADHF